MVQYLVWNMRTAIGGSGGLDFLKLGREEVQFQVKFADNLDMDILALTETYDRYADRRTNPSR
jgi:hypothetical protein